MRKEIIETGKTVEAAINAACEKLGCDRDQCEWEIIDLPKKTFLGLKTIPAKVKVAFEAPEQKPQQPKRDKKPVPRQERPEPKREQKPVKPRAAEPAPVKAEPVKSEPKPVPAPPKQEVSVETPDDLDMPPRVPVTEGFTDKEVAAMDYISGILKDFGLTAQLQLSREGSGICIDINGEGLGTIIGRRGETLDAIQYLTGLVANRLDGDYLRVTVDCGDYRTKRKDTLESLARKLAAQVLKTNISKTLEPMNPFERRVIHATVSQIEGVSSSSVGEEPNRRVVITSPTARRSTPYRSSSGRDGDRGGRRPDRRGDGGRGGRGGDRDRGGRRPSSSRGPRQQSAPAQEGPPKETPESAVMSDAPIGKLDLE